MDLDAIDQDPVNEMDIDDVVLHPTLDVHQGKILLSLRSLCRFETKGNFVSSRDRSTSGDRYRDRERSRSPYQQKSNSRRNRSPSDRERRSNSPSNRNGSSKKR